MRKFTSTLLAGAALAMPAMVPAIAAQSSPQNPQVQQQNSAPQQPSNQQQPSQQQANQQQPNQPNGQPTQQQAANQSIPPRQLGRSGVRKVQQALDKAGFRAGRDDGIDGTQTRTALRQFQKSKGIQDNGRINQQTLSDLGVNVASNTPRK